MKEIELSAKKEWCEEHTTWQREQSEIIDQCKLVFIMAKSHRSLDLNITT